MLRRTERGNSDSGINFDKMSIKNPWVCFVEGKMLSDCSNKTKYDPFRNKLARIIESLLCFTGKEAFHEVKYFFTLLTPKQFKHAHSRLYGYKFEEYMSGEALLRDINYSNLKKRADRYPNDLKERIKNLSLSWVTYEEIIEKEFDGDWDIIKGLVSNDEQDKVRELFIKISGR